MIAPGTEPPAVSVANRIAGRVARIEVGTVNAEVVLDVGGGKSLAASITARSAEALAQAARGRIMDADFAQETANMSRAQILQQAGTAMVAQANQLPQNVLSLLR